MFKMFKKKDKTNVEADWHFPELTRQVDKHSVCCDDESIKNRSACADRFHEELKKELGLSVVASFAKNYKTSCSLYIWAREDKVLETLLDGKGEKSYDAKYCISECGYPAENIVQCLNRVLKEFGFEYPANFDEPTYITETTPMGFKRKVALAKWVVTVLNFDRYQKDGLYYNSTGAVNRLLRNNYKSYHVRCEAVCMGDAPRNHYFLFDSDAEIKKAKADGTIDRIRREGYLALQGLDKYSYVGEQEYCPIMISRDKFTKEELFLLSRT